VKFKKGKQKKGTYFKKQLSIAFLLLSLLFLALGLFFTKKHLLKQSLYRKQIRELKHVESLVDMPLPHFHEDSFLDETSLFTLENQEEAALMEILFFHPQITQRKNIEEVHRKLLTISLQKPQILPKEVKYSFVSLIQCDEEQQLPPLFVNFKKNIIENEKKIIQKRKEESSPFFLSCFAFFLLFSVPSILILKN